MPSSEKSMRMYHLMGVTRTWTSEEEEPAASGSLASLLTRLACSLVVSAGAEGSNPTSSSCLGASVSIFGLWSFNCGPFCIY